ncbi:MAG: sulfite exporter TauE/SafE family protein [Actinomycetota bacterium]
MTPLQALLGILVGFIAGILAGALGIGGGTVTTPAVEVLLGGTAIQAVATPLPVIFPTAISGAIRYHRAGEISYRAVKWAALPGALGAAGGAYLTEIVNTRWLLLVIAVLLGAEAVRLAIGGEVKERPRGSTPGWQYAFVGLAAGLVSGLLGVGGGIVFVPAVTGLLGMPVKRALGTSLALITALVIPGTLVHASLGNIDWAIFAVLVIGVVPGAQIGAAWALRARERTLRMTVAIFLLTVAVGYGALETLKLIGTIQ